MTYTCRTCKRTFGSELQLELHKDKCSDEMLVCSQCGEKFPERRATRDGWHYRCPNAECDGSGIGEDLRPVGDFTVAPTR